LHIQPRRALACLALLLSSETAIAVCNDKEGTVDSLYRNCYKPRLDLSNKDLASAVAQTTKLLTERRGGTIATDWFKDSQAAWERYRYLFCEVRAISEAGPQSSRGLNRVDCEIDLNAKRLEELQTLRESLRP
jgi:uncharacterized protein YecT (DUF1311 family)